MLRHLFLGLLLALLSQPGFAQNAPAFAELSQKANTVLENGIAYFQSIAIEGGYVYHYSLDLKEKWGEGKTDEYTIEVQPPGTPAVGMSFLRAYQVTQNPDFLQAAEDAANALIRGQNELGGWEHKIHFNRPLGKRVSFDDDQTQSAISFLMALDQEVDSPSLTAAIEKALEMMQAAQWENGAWPHRYPKQDNYHDYATFNDEGINDCIRVMLEAHRLYGSEAYGKSVALAGRFLMVSQLPPPQPGWAQQYNEYLQPAWARSFEPPAVCPSVTVRNVHSLIDLYLHTGNREYLEAIPDALRWLEASQLPNGKWGRFLELGTNKPLYYDRGRIRVNSLEELSIERRTGYGYEVDLSGSIEQAKRRYERVIQLEIDSFPYEVDNISKAEMLKKLAALSPQAEAIIAAQDEQGRWISFQDRFRKIVPGETWSGAYREEDRISSALFNENVAILCEFIAGYQALK